MDLQLGLFQDHESGAGTGEEAFPGPEVGPATVDGHTTRIAARLPRDVRLGTSSWSFPGWEGLVYDRRASQRVLASASGLAAYARHPLLRTAGVDRTYYRPMDADEFRSYAGAVPDDFRFLVKAPRAITSPLDPEDRSVRSRNPRFLDPGHAIETIVLPMLEGLGDKAGVLLFQFPPIPPNLVGGPEAFIQLLRRFLAALPDGPVYAVELRTPTFLDERYAEALDAAGAAHCYNVHPAMTSLERQREVVPPLYQPAVVVRWMLHSGLRYEAARDRYRPFDRIVDADPTSRELIATLTLDAVVAERPAFVVANNKAEGSSPLTLLRLAERIADWSPEGTG